MALGMSVRAKAKKKEKKKSTYKTTGNSGREL